MLELQGNKNLSYPFPLSFFLKASIFLKLNIETEIEYYGKNHFTNQLQLLFTLIEMKANSSQTLLIPCYIG